MNKVHCLRQTIAFIKGVEVDSIKGNNTCDLLVQIVEMIGNGQIDADLVPITDAEIDSAWK